MIKMKVNKDNNSKCDECGCQWKNTKEMYTILICGKKINLCKKCTDIVFHKTLTASCKYNERLKDKVDMQRIRNENNLKMEKK